MPSLRTTPILLAAAALALSGCGGPNAQEPENTPEPTAATADGSATSGPLTVDGAWLAEPANPSTTAGYLTVTNTGTEDTALVEAETSLSERAELHTVATTDSGAARMRPIDQIPVPAGQTVELASGGLHLMVLGIEDPPEVGDTATITLTFDTGETVQVDAPVRQRTATGRSHREEP